MVRTTCFLFALVAIAVAIVGCEKPSEFAGKVGSVSGTITLDGNPLADADVVFTPTAEDAGGSSHGTTDSQGMYELYITAEEAGAWIGEHQVAISKTVDDDATETTVEVVPPKYNTNTELTATVQAGANTCDFALESGDYQPVDVDAEEG